MAFVPAVPGFSPVSYGQGYGDWKQYAGFNKDNPFGTSPEISVSQKPEVAASTTPVAPPTIDTEMVKPDYAIMPPYGQFGAPASGQLGGLSGSLSLVQQARKHFGE